MDGSMGGCADGWIENFVERRGGSEKKIDMHACIDGLERRKGFII